MGLDRLEIIGRVVGLFGATGLHDHNREKKKPAEGLEIHPPIKGNPGAKRKRVSTRLDYILIKRVSPITNAAIAATITRPKALRMMYSQVLEITATIDGSRFQKRCIALT